MKLKCVNCGKEHDLDDICKKWKWRPVDQEYLYNCCQGTLKRYGLPIQDIASIAHEQIGLLDSVDFNGDQEFDSTSVVKKPDLDDRTVEYINSNWFLFWHKPKNIQRHQLTLFSKTRKQIEYSVKHDGTLVPLKRSYLKCKRKAEYVGSDAILLYPDLDNPRNKKCVISKDSTHSATQCKINGNTVTNEKGYRMVKASHGVWQGAWYFEVEIVNDLGNARIGWSQISGDLQAPCGYDDYSYSLRNIGGLFHQARNWNHYGEFRKGDILGVAISIPESVFYD
jgi:hypothetical protein